MSYEKFSIDEFLIRVLPGGFFVGVLFLWFDKPLTFSSDLDFLYTFLFVCFAFIFGELLQMLAHELELLVDLFFKCRRPSKVFLYKNNPVLKNEYKKNDIFTNTNTSQEERDLFNKEYSSLSIWWWGRDKSADNASQNIFWKLYSQVSNLDEIKTVNRNYLFSRVMTVEFMLLSLLFAISKMWIFAVVSLIIFAMFLWRSRGVARGLVFKTVLLNLKR